MTRNIEGATIVAASFLAAFGVTLVNFAGDGNLDAQTALTFLVFLIAFGGIHLAVRRWAPKASALLIAPVTALAALGFLEIYRLDPVRSG
ncbi:MAG: FtsW/RodA/SpoVE family cell cycle protein, partial [Acidimicrobiia bacterium]